jgi:hypothetical protein
LIKCSPAKGIFPLAKVIVIYSSNSVDKL